MKRKHDHSQPTAGAAKPITKRAKKSVSATSPPAEFFPLYPLPTKVVDKFELPGDFDECLAYASREEEEEGGAEDGEERQRQFSKPEMKICQQFSMFIQNSVYTCALKNTDLEGHDGMVASAPNKGNSAFSGMDLGYVTRSLRYNGVQFNSPRFDAMVSRDQTFDSANLMFNTGRLVNTGCSLPKHALGHIKRDTDLLRKILPVETALEKPKLQNLVSTGAFPNRICTYLMAVKHSDICSRLRPFPGTMIRDARRFGERVILVFPSGRVCHSGGRNPKQVYDDITTILPLLIKCQATPANLKDNEKCRLMLAKSEE